MATRFSFHKAFAMSSFCPVDPTVARRYTLTQYFIDQRKHYPHATGDFNALMLDVALACKAISRTVAFGNWRRLPGQPNPASGIAHAEAKRWRCSPTTASPR